MNHSYPQAVQTFHDVLLRLPGVYDVSSGIDSLDSLTSEHLALAEFTRLPLGILRRTDGGLKQEVITQFEFYLEPNHAGWRTLEFLAWFVRDAATSGEHIQLRPFALPPKVGEQIQLGNTLRFHIDLFLPNTSEDLEPVLLKIAELAQFLNLCINLYEDVIFGVN